MNSKKKTNPFETQLFEMFTQLSKSLNYLIPNDEEIEKVFSKLSEQYKDQDAWGLDLDFSKKMVKYLIPLYRHYFKVRTFGIENIQDEPYVMVSNHSGQIAIDGVLVGLASVLESPNPRIVRPMIERFMAALPYVAEVSFKAGAVLGDRANCLKLLEKNQSVLVFPEGVRGVSKSTNEFYELQKFTKGFYRMALTSQKKILPIAVIGAEEFYPFVYQARGLAKILGLPAFPVFPTMAFLGPMSLLPLPSPVDIYFGKPIDLPEGLSGDAPDKEINPFISQVHEQVKQMMEHGLKNKRDFINPKDLINKITSLF